MIAIGTIIVKGQRLAPSRKSRRRRQRRFKGRGGTSVERRVPTGERAPRCAFVPGCVGASTEVRAGPKRCGHEVEQVVDLSAQELVAPTRRSPQNLDEVDPNNRDEGGEERRRQAGGRRCRPVSQRATRVTPSGENRPSSSARNQSLVGSPPAIKIKLLSILCSTLQRMRISSDVMPARDDRINSISSGINLSTKRRPLLVMLT